MIQINDDDLPITVANKLISATKEIDNRKSKALNELIGGDGTSDMFGVDELKEIAQYLMVFVENHPNDY